MTTYLLPDGSTIDRATCLAYRRSREAEGTRLEAVRFAFQGESADGVDEASAARHLAAVAHLGREPETSEEYAEALEWVDRQGVTIAAIEQGDEDDDGPDRFTATKVAGDALDRVVMAELETEGGEITASRYVACFERHARALGLYGYGRA
jgi:hypothetical protein